MAESRDDIFAEPVENALNTSYMGRPFTHLRSVESTQNIVSAAGRRGEPEGFTVSADEQLAGRGRFKRAWVSPPGGSILMSVLFRPPPDVLPFVVMIAALAVRSAVIKAAPELKPEIKWPNDILLNGRKTCGILVETIRDEPAHTFSILGMGVNVNWDTASDPEIAETATSLGRETGRVVPRLSVLIPLLEELEHLNERAKTGDDILGRWRDNLVTLGRRVVVRGGDFEIEGVAEDVDGDGALLVRNNRGVVHTVRAGDVTLKE
jgi:BirA family biotin operon repressor/biotin-[acetyl-CoA-carboxylase] ligase